MNAAFASTNEHKRRELALALPGWQLELLEGAVLEEEGETYYENARAKARFGRTLADFDLWILAEDSGLEVDALGGRPGLYSARYAAPGEDPVAKLLAELAAAEGAPRRARYLCELVCLSPELRELRGSGQLEGTIAEEPRGSQGFGYDPVFIPDGESRTVAELGDAWKAEHSHRARAARALLTAQAAVV